MLQDAFNLLAWTQPVMGAFEIHGASSEISPSELPDPFSLRILMLYAQDLKDMQGDRCILCGNFNLLDGS